MVSPPRARARFGTAGRCWIAALCGAVLLTACGPEPGASSPPDRVTASPAPTQPPESTSADTGPDPAGERKRKRDRVTVLMTGDVLLHDGLWHDARLDGQRTGRGGLDFRPLLAHMRPAIRGADLAICHLETPLAPEGGPFFGYPTFSAPPSIAPALRWAGYDVCTTASNHTVDQGFDGVRRTIEALDRAGVAHTGSYDHRRDAAGPLWMRVGDADVVLISATFGLNGLPLPEGRPWAVNLIDTQRITRQATRARSAGADIVLVALHWGDEYVEQPSAFQTDVARALARTGQVDLIYGHHAHVVQPYDRVHGVWVLYGLGNAVAQQEKGRPELYAGNAAQVTFRRSADGRFRVARVAYRPTMVTYFDGVHPMRYLDVQRALGDPGFAALRPRLKDARERVEDAVGAAGALRRVVTPARH